MKLAPKTFLAPVIIFFLLSCLYFFTRLFLLKNLPLFVDEITYIHWAQLGFANPDARFASLGDGKQPLFIWLMILVMQVIHNPVIAGRATAIFAGFGSMIALGLLTYELFGKKWMSFLSMLLYVVCPFSLLIDRLALYDSLVTTLSLLSLYLSVLLVKRLSLSYAFLLAFSLGAGILNKSSGFLSVYVLPFTLLLLPKGKFWIERFLRWAGYITIAVGVALVYYSVLFLSSGFSHIDEKNTLYLNSPSSLLTNVIPLFSHNLLLFGQWIWLLFTPFFLLLVGIGFWGGRKKEKILLVSTCLVELIGLALLARNPYPRYIYFMVMPLMPIAAFGLSSLYSILRKSLLSCVVAGLVFLSFALYTDYTMLTNIEYAPLPTITKTQLVTGWSAGGGTGEIAKYLLEQSKQRTMLVMTDGKYGSLSTGIMDVYFSNSPQVERLALDSFPSSVPQDILKKAGQEPVYLFLNQMQTPPPWKLILLLKLEKGHGPNYVSLYKLAQ